MKTDNQFIQDLTRGNLRKQLLRFSVPFMLMNLMQALYTVIDMIVVGQFVGSAGLSAVSMGGMMTAIMLEFGSGIATGGQVYIAQLVGAGRRKELNDVIWTMFLILLLLAVCVGGIVIVFRGVFLQWINTPSEALAYADDYVVCCSAGLIFLYGYNAISAIFRGIGNSVKPMQFALISTVVNIVLDLLFVGVFHWAAAGAALATVIAQAVAFFASIGFFYKTRDSIGLDSIRFDCKLARRIMKLGAPMILMQVAIKGSMMFINAHVNRYGVAASAVVGVGDKLYSVVSIVTNAILVSISAAVAQNMGAGKPKRARQSVIYGWEISCAFVFLITLLAVFFPQTLFRAFTDDSEIIALAPTYLHISLIMYWGFALMCPALGLIIGVGNTMLNSIIGILDGVVARISLSLLLGEACEMGLWGFVLGNALAGLVSVMMSIGYFFFGKWEDKSVLT